VKKKKTNPYLRNARKQTHDEFDKLWKLNYMTRKEAYNWLSTIFDIPLRRCHIGLFSVYQCNVVKIAAIKKIECIKRLERNKKIKGKL